MSLEELPDLVARVRSAVVMVEVERAEGRSNGSGFAIDQAPGDGAAGVAITNAHVVAGGERFLVVLDDGTEVDASVRVVDPATDIAVLDLVSPAPERLGIRELDSVRVGEPVVAIGSPFGLLGTVTTGIVSGLDRSLPSPGGTPIDNMIQTDALINPGNSGGPLIGLDGRAIGVNDQVRVGLDGHGPTGLGFAVPAETAWAVYREVCETGEGRIRRGSIGVRLQFLPFRGETMRELGQKGGAMVVDEPLAGSPAAQAGIARGDVIVRFDGEPVREPGTMLRLLDRSRIARTCALTLLRAGKTVEVEITPTEREDSCSGTEH